jgi:ATP-dependent Clp protease ATP-binding subunit ClpA
MGDGSSDTGYLAHEHLRSIPTRSIAGAKRRGQFEERLEAVFDEIKQSEGQVATFIDEIHTVVGAGALCRSPSR